MQKPFSLFVGLRYTRAKRRNHFISFIALISMLGIGLGVTVMITVLSVMNGFERELRDRILGMAPHIVVTERGNDLNDWKQVAEQASKVNDVIAAAPFIDAQAMLRHRGVTRYGLVRGIEPESEKEVSIMDENMKIGSLEDLVAGEFNIILGVGLARSMGAAIGDKITLVVVEGTTASPAGVIPRLKRFTLVGLFEVKAEVDNSLAVIHLKDAARLMKKGDAVSAVRLQTKDVLNAISSASEVREQLGPNYYANDWSRFHGNLFQAIKMEKKMMFILLAFIVMVATFNIVSTLVMVVTDKQSDIAILRTLGASPSMIMKIFIIQGSVNGLIGTLLGLIGGVTLSLTLPDLVSWVENSFGVQLVPGDVYFVGFLPSQLQWSDVTNVTVAAFIMSLLATIYPAWKAARTKPAEALRYE